MKCIQCGTDNKLKERYDNLGRCKNCGHEFAFELRTDTPYYLSKVTDSFFHNLITAINSPNLESNTNSLVDSSSPDAYIYTTESFG